MGRADKTLRRRWVVTAVLAAVCLALGVTIALAAHLRQADKSSRFEYTDLDAATYKFHSDGFGDFGDYAYRLSRREVASLRQRLAVWHIEPRTDSLAQLLQGSLASIALDFHGRTHTYSLWHDMPQFSDLSGDVSHLDAYLNAYQSKLQPVGARSPFPPAGSGWASDR